MLGIIECYLTHAYSSLIFQVRSVVVVLFDPFRGMGAWRNSTEPNSRARLQGLDQRSPTSCCLNVVVRPRPLTRGGPKWRDNYTEGSDHPVASTRLDFIQVSVA